MVYLTETQKEFQKKMRAFADKELSAGAIERAKMDHVPPLILAKLSSEGLLGLTTPVEYGGNPVDCVSTGIVFEEICGIDYSTFSVMLSHVVIPFMMRWASEDLKKEWLPALSAGDRLVCFGNTEPDCGSDAAAISTRAIRQDEAYVINGEKTSISGGMQADAILLTAKTTAGAGASGVTCFFIPFAFDGVSRTRFSDMGAHPSGRAAIFFADVRIPSSHRIGEEGEGFTKVMSGLDFARVLVVLAGIGMARVSLLEAIEHSKTKMIFGAPQSKFEGFAFRLAENATLVEASRLLCYQALKLRDEDLPHVKECAMAKWYASESVCRVIHDALIMLGAKGYSEAGPIEQRFRDSLGTKIGDGTSEIMKLIIAREILGRKFGPVV